MSNQTFRSLHQGTTPLLLPNAWDAGSARLIENLGAKAIATTSAGVSWSRGYPDGDALPAEQLVAAARDFGGLNLLVNNASEFQPDEIGDLDRDRFDRHFAVNLRAPLFLAQVFAAQAPAGGSIVNVLDQRVYRPTPRFLSYGLAKSGLYVATTTLAQALAPHLRVNAVAPGPTLRNAWQDDDAFARRSAAMPLGHGPTPEEVADAVLFLARANNITGETIAVDGGQHIVWHGVPGASHEE